MPRLLVALISLHALLWALIPTFLHTAPPLDMVELVSLADTGTIANYKHPNLPGLILDALRVLGVGMVGLYWVSQLCVAATLFIVYRLSRSFVSDSAAAVASALLLGVYYFTLPTPELNHNVLQMPLWAAVIALAWWAVRDGRLGQWVALAICAGALLWTKYSAGLLLLAVGMWFLIDAQARSRLRTYGPWLVVLLSGAIALPQGLYLIQSDFLPLEYAQIRAQNAQDGPAVFLLTQLANHIPLALIAAAAGLWGSGAWTARARDRRTVFLFAMFAGPLALICLVGLLGSGGLRSMWGAPMFSLSGLVVVYFFGGRLNHHRERRAQGFALALTSVLAILYATQLLVRDYVKEKPSRVLWPQAQIAAAVADRAGSAVPPTIVGPYWEAGLVAMQPDYWRQVFIDADPLKSPHVADFSHGYAVVWRGSPSPSLSAFIQQEGLDPADALRVMIPWSERQPPIELKLLLSSP